MYSPDKSWGCFLFGTYDCTYKPTAYKNPGRFWPFLQITVTEKLPQQAHSVGGGRTSILQAKIRGESFGRLLTTEQLFDIIRVSGKYTERYRRGHNEAVLKTVCLKGHVGSNPTRSAKYNHIIRLGDVPKLVKGLPC